ncbi:MAG: hypothetical protein WCO84_08735 [bacterium]
MPTTKTQPTKSRRRSSLRGCVPCPTFTEKFESDAARRRFAVLRDCLEQRGFAKASSLALAVVVHGVEDAKSRVVLAFYNAVSDATTRWHNTDILDEVFHRSTFKRVSRRVKSVARSKKVVA